MTEISDQIEGIFAARYAERTQPSIDGFPHLQDALINLCQSEIEQRLLVELMFADWKVVDWSDVEIYDPTTPFQPKFDECLVISPQFPIGQYRIDLGVLFLNFRSGKILKIAVECDGHDFHERTKEQAEHDKKRDREVQKLGFMVFRFTGSEIFRKGKDRAQEVADYCYKWWQEQAEHGK